MKSMAGRAFMGHQLSDVEIFVDEIHYIEIISAGYKRNEDFHSIDAPVCDLFNFN